MKNLANSGRLTPRQRCGSRGAVGAWGGGSLSPGTRLSSLVQSFWTPLRRSFCCSTWSRRASSTTRFRERFAEGGGPAPAAAPSPGAGCCCCGNASGRWVEIKGNHARKFTKLSSDGGATVASGAAAPTERIGGRLAPSCGMLYGWPVRPAKGLCPTT